MTDVALRDNDSWADMLPKVAELARQVANTSFVSDSFKGKPAEIAACILTGREIGIGPMEALGKIHSIKGKPTISAELMRSLALRAGHDITFPVLTNDKVTAKGRRAGSDTWTEVTWTIKDAERIGVANKDTWRRHPRQMLEARASSELCRLLFPDALGGISYTPEELSDEEAPATKTAVKRSTGRTSEPPPIPQEPTLTPPEPLQGDTEPPQAEPTPEPAVEPDIVDAEIVEDEPVMLTAVHNRKSITGAQVKMMGAQMSRLGMDRDQALSFCTEHTGRDITNRDDLTKDEADTIIAALGALVDLAGGSHE
jgi:hypothetical protein